MPKNSNPAKSSSTWGETSWEDVNNGHKATDTAIDGPKALEPLSHLIFTTIQ